MEGQDKDNIQAPLLSFRNVKSCDDCSLSSKLCRRKLRYWIVFSFHLCSAHAQDMAILSGPLAALLLKTCVKIDDPLLDHEKRLEAVSMFAAMSWVFIWWVTEALPIEITALAPLFLLPFFKIESANEVSRAYITDTSFLIIGSFILAAAVEHYNLHKRLALNMLLLFGGKTMDPRLIILGLSLATACVSMFVDNGATAVMFLAVGEGVLQKVKDASESSCVPNNITSGTEGQELEEGKLIALDSTDLHVPQKEAVQNFSRAVILAISYAATIGGMMTLTGNGVNLVLAELWRSSFPSASPIQYLQWLLFGFPLGTFILLASWAILCLQFCASDVVQQVSASLRKLHIREELNLLGSMPFAEVAILITFLILVIFWTTKSLGGSVPGWADLFDGYPGNGTITIFMATVLFILPSRKEPGKKIMDWSKCGKLPWGIVLLVGGGFALADGIRSSGLSDLISHNLEFLQSTPYWLIAPLIALVTSVATEFTQNISTATMLVPLVIDVAVAIHMHPLYLMVPAAVGAQFSYMLPIATAPNAMGYATGYLQPRDMTVSGLALKIVALLLLTVLMPSLGSVVFKTDSPFEI